MSTHNKIEKSENHFKQLTMETKVKPELLIKAAEELNKLMGLDPPLDTKAKNLDERITEAATLLDAEDELTNSTKAVLIDLAVWQDQSEEVREKFKQMGIFNEDDVNKKEEDANNQPTELLDDVETAVDMRTLKELVKSNDEFKSLRGKLTGYKKGQEEELKEDMFETLDTQFEKSKPPATAKHTTKAERKKQIDEKAPTKPKPKLKKDQPRPKKEVPVTQFGHRLGTFSAAIDELLLQTKKPLTKDEIIKKTGCKPYKATSHIRHLQKVKNIPIVETEDGVVLKR